jgi:hypothetical protein
MPPDNYGSSRRQKGSTAKAKIHHAEASAKRAQPEGEGNIAHAKAAIGGEQGEDRNHNLLRL